jgi:putative tricarboxylic transport membrane protein
MLLTNLASGSTVKALMMALVGLLVGNIGLDLVTGLPRFTFRISELTDGVGLIPNFMGLFGITEVFENLEQNLDKRILSLCSKTEALIMLLMRSVLEPLCTRERSVLYVR